MLKKEIFQLPWSNNWFYKFTKMLKTLPLYLKLLWEIVSISKISLGWETRLSAISSTSHAPLHCYLKEDLSQHLLPAKGVTPCRHWVFLIDICTSRGLGFKSGPSPSEGIAMQKHTCTHTPFFFSNAKCIQWCLKEWKILGPKILHCFCMRAEWIFIV